MLNRPSGFTVTIAVLALVAAPVLGLSQASASEPFIGEIKMFGGNFAPRGYAFCNGQLLPIAQNTALFSLLGTIYGGDGRTTFALPDMRGRSPMHWGSGPGLTSRTIGQRLGVERVTLTQAQIPPLTLQLKCTTTRGNDTSPSGNFLADDRRETQYSDVGSPNATMNSGAVAAPNCQGQSHENMQPSLCVTFIIALVGIYPSRS